MPPRPGLGEYSDLVNEMPGFIQSKNRFATLSGEQDELFTRANERPRVGGPEATIAALISALPAVIGAALMGEEGFAQGAKSSAVGVGQTFDNLKVMGDEEQKAALTKYTRNEKEMSDLRNYVQDLDKTALTESINTKQAMQAQTHTDEQNLLNRNLRRDEGVLNRANATNNAGAGAKATAAEKKAQLEHTLNDPNGREFIKMGLTNVFKKADGTPDVEKIEGLMNNPEALGTSLDVLGGQGGISGIAARFGYVDSSQKNLKMRRETIDNTERNRISEQIKELRTSAVSHPVYKDAAEKVPIINTLLDNLYKNDSTGDRMARVELVKLDQGGRLSDKDMTILASALQTDLRGLGNYIGGTVNAELTDDQRQSFIEAVSKIRDRTSFQLDSLQSELKMNAKSQMPGASDEQVNSTVDSIGHSLREQLKQSPGQSKTYDYKGGKVLQQGDVWFGIDPTGNKIRLNEAAKKKVIAELGPQ